MFCHFDHDLEEIEFSNPAYLEELEKIMILKKFFVQNGPSVQILRIWAQKYFIFFCQKMVVLFVCCNEILSDFYVLFFKIEALDELRKMLPGKKLFGDFPICYRPWIIFNTRRFTRCDWANFWTETPFWTNFFFKLKYGMCFMR